MNIIRHGNLGPRRFCVDSDVRLGILILFSYLVQVLRWCEIEE